MRVRVEVKPNSKSPGIEVAAGYLIVRVKEPPKEGKATEAVLRAVAAHYGVPFRDVQLVSGATSRHKTLELPDR